MIKICEENKCFGCSLCHDVCPTKAISMSYIQGHYRPSIDATKCVDCQKCVKICPSTQDSIELPKRNKEDVKCYAAWSKDSYRHFESASGGISLELAYQFIVDGGFVVGVIFDKQTQLAKHICIDDIDKLEAMAKSKYILSDKINIWSEIKQKIQKSKCLFFGIPCEVYAFKRFMKNYVKDAQNYYCVDLLCHGGASPLCFTQHLAQVPLGRIMNKVTFRGGKFDCAFAGYHNDTLLYLNGQYQDEYFSEFMRHSIFQPRCYECPFANANRLGDITLADFWGIADEIKRLSNTGISLILVNNEKGEDLLNSIKSRIVLFERSINEAIAGNDTLRCPTDKPADYDEFWHNIHEKGFHQAVRQSKKMLK